MRLLLDTHVWIWLVDGREDQLGPRAYRAMLRAGRGGDLLVSVISVWEVAMLDARGRISLAIGIEDWVARGLSIVGLQIADLSPEIAIESARLPGQAHRDPADRILLATARRTGARLITRDARILEYARRGHVLALDASP